jgi:hypothetical protein
MHLPKPSEPEFQEIGGEPLTESGFESEAPANEFESYQPPAEGGINR